MLKNVHLITSKHFDEFPQTKTLCIPCLWNNYIVCKMIMKCNDAISFVLSQVYICGMNELICILLY